jgi:hypothetical protein
MKASMLYPMTAVIIVFGLALLQVEAQQPRPGSRQPAVAPPAAIDAAFEGSIKEMVKIRRLDGVGRTGLVKTPEFRTSMPGGTKPPQEWVEIKTTFDTEPEWIEDLVFQYYVLVYNRKEAKTPYSFIQATVRYGDVEQGRGHYSTMYIPPSAVKRYGYPVALGVEISINGKLVDSKYERDSSIRVAEGWWKKDAIVGRKDVVTRQGCLLNRKESPFSLVNIDDHEVAR